MSYSRVGAAVALCLVLFAATFAARAQQLVYASNLVVPLIAETPSYQSAIYVHNPSAGVLSITFTYTGATSSASPGVRTCPSIQIPAGTVLKVSLTALCPSLNPGSNVGALATSCCTYPNFAVYTRTQTSSGNGFSVEGMVDGYYCCSSFVRESIGLLRQAVVNLNDERNGPTETKLQSNCYVWNQDATRDGRFVATLLTGDGLLIADDILNLAPGEFVSLQDVFAALGAPAGDYVNARATFESIVPVGGGTPVSFIASCTVQNISSLDADFRIAKYHN